MDEVPFNTLFARVVLENKVRGRVLVDDEDSPSVCLVVHKYGMALLCGNARNESFDRELRGFLKNDALNDGWAKWVICHPNGWEATVSGLLGSDLVRLGGLDDQESTRAHRKGNIILQTERVNFKFDRRRSLPKLEPPPGFELRAVDANLYERIEGSVVPRCFWNSAEDFLRSGIGFALLADGRVVSTCFSSFVTDDKLELGVETDPAYRKRGLSVYPATQLMDCCLTTGYEPVWACERTNIPSFRLALKLGFVPSTFHPYYVLPLGQRRQATETTEGSSKA